MIKILSLTFIIVAVSVFKSRPDCLLGMLVVVFSFWSFMFLVTVGLSRAALQAAHSSVNSILRDLVRSLKIQLFHRMLPFFIVPLWAKL